MSAKRLTRISLVVEVQGRGQVPHLDGAVRVAREDEPSRPGAHPAGPFALVHAERAHGAVVHRLDHAHSKERCLRARFERLKGSLFWIIFYAFSIFAFM